MLPRSKEHCEKIRQRMLGNNFGEGKRNKEFCDNISNKMIGNKNGAGGKGKKFLTSERLKKLWSDPEYKDREVAIKIKQLKNKISNSELFIQNILDKYYPNDWKFVGNGDFVLGGKCPDFVNVNGKKLIIEVFYYSKHTYLEGLKRKILFTKFGYKTLIIWRKELRRKNLQPIINKIINFNLFN
jgi:hypothetical protein